MVPRRTMRNRLTIALLACAGLACLAPASRSQPQAAPDTANPSWIETTTPTGFKPPQASPPSTGLPSSLSSTDASRILALLRDPAALAQFEANLEALTKATGPGPAAPFAAPTVASAAPATGQPATAPVASATASPGPAQPPTPAPPAAAANPAAGPAASSAKPESTPVQLKPNGLGARLVVFGSALLNQTSAKMVAAFSAIRSIPLLWRWAETMATDPLAKELVINTAWRVATAVAAGTALEWVVRRAIGRVVVRFHDYAPASHDDRPVAGAEQDQEPSDPDAVAETGDSKAGSRRRRLRPTAWTLLRRIPFVLGRLLLDLLPIAAFVLAAYIVSAAGLAEGRQTRLVTLAVITAYAVITAAMALARMILSPEHPRLRLVHLSSDDAAYAMRWLRWIVIVGVLGYTAGTVGVLLGMSPLAQGGLLKAAGFVVHTLTAIVVVQKRREIARWIRERTPAPTGFLAVLRSRLAAVWHWIAIFFLVATWLVWAIEVPDGYALVMRIFAEVIGVIVGARLTLIVLLGAIDRAMRPRQATNDGPRAFSDRLTGYYPLVRGVVRFIVGTAALLGLLQLWGINALGWFLLAPLGQSIVSALATIAATVVIALFVWEAANARFESHLDRLTRERENARAARLRTLMPMLRTTLMIAIVIVAGLSVLSEIGINIAPLLAGAGIAGVAIGFGSQKLVQDLITGIFLLLENAMQVGDWVTVSGLSGSVEHLSVRTIKLRAGDGSVHIIPFSAVTTVTNTNRGLGNAPVDVMVAFDEDVDRVSEELKAIVAGMQDDPAFGPKMLSGLELWGVDKVDGASVTIAGQIPCTDTGRYPVQREFNRRLKKRFEELGIAIYNPSVSYMIEAADHLHVPEPPPGAEAPHVNEPVPQSMPRAAE